MRVLALLLEVLADLEDELVDDAELARRDLLHPLAELVLAQRLLLSENRLFFLFLWLLLGEVSNLCRKSVLLLLALGLHL